VDLDSEAQSQNVPGLKRGGEKVTVKGEGRIWFKGGLGEIVEKAD